jgi:hypothetical protein
VVTTVAQLKPPDQIFVVGMNGSGTTMLLDHLSNHSWIYGFQVETKSLPFFITHEKEYGDLEIEANLRRLWSDMKESVAERVNSVPRDLPHAGIAIRSAAGCFDHMMGQLAADQGQAHLVREDANVRAPHPLARQCLSERHVHTHHSRWPGLRRIVPSAMGLQSGSHDCPLEEGGARRQAGWKVARRAIHRNALRDRNRGARSGISRTARVLVPAI